VIHTLTAEQQEVVDADDPAIVVTASAGSGKTDVIAHRVERILRDEPSASFRVLAVSYTVKAADELAERLRDRVGDVRRIEAETIHAFAHSLVRQHGTWEGLPPEPEVLHRDEDRVELLTSWLAQAGRRLDSDSAGDELRRLDLARARRTETPLLHEYNEALLARGALDYPAMLEVASRLVAREWVRTQLSQTYRHVIVDEAQNLTPAQFHLLISILGTPPSPVSAMLVGDEKQSIVQFAGADPGLIKRFEVEYSARRIELTVNFRSSAAIAQVADAVAARLGDESRLRVASAAAGLVEVEREPSEQAEGEAVANWVEEMLHSGIPDIALAVGEKGPVAAEDIAILARSAAALRWTSDALAAANIPHVVASDARDWMSSGLGRAVVDLIAFRAGPGHPSTRSHLVQTARVGVDALEASPVLGFTDLVVASEAGEPVQLLTAVAGLLNSVAEDPWLDDKALLEHTWQQFLDRTPVAERTYVNLQLHIARTQRGEPSAPGVRLLTVHKSQGKEFRAVSVVGLNQGQFPDFRQTSPEEKRAELHCFYVAVTRASRILRLSRALVRQGRNGPWEPQESEFLAVVLAAGRGGAG